MSYFSVRISRKTRCTFDASGLMEAWSWAREQFGKPGRRWYFDTNFTFYFMNQEDANWFALRWL
jgi:hypothetical protein